MHRMNRDEWRVTTDDRLVIRWYSRTRGVRSQGKRVGKACPLTAEERRAYVRGNATTAVRCIMDRRGMTLGDAFALLDEARSGRW